MEWLLSIDVALFRLINQTISNSVLDRLMPFFSWNALFIPAAIVAGVALLWKGGRRGRVFLAMLAVVLALGDGVICKALKEGIDRPRPFRSIPETRLLAGRGKSESFPSSHAANWGALSALVFIYYRRKIWLPVTLGAIVAISRVYVGVHYPSDVIGGALLGGLYAFGIVWLIQAIWQSIGRRWFPLWWSRFPSLFAERSEIAPHATVQNVEAISRSQWLRVGYLLIAGTLVLRLGYIGGDTIELSEDEAYQWLWSKHLDLSYYSKPPMIAYTQFLGTSIWGDSAFGVRFFSPVIAAIIALCSLRFLARETNIKAGFWLILVLLSTPLLAAGATLMTIDPLSVLFWTLGMYSGWRAVKEDSLRHWLWVGLWMGLGFLSKFTGLFQLLSWAVFFIVWKPARAQLRRPGPYLALLITALATIPVIIWNAQHDWITVTHLANRGGLDRKWQPSVKFPVEFIGAEIGLLNPVFFFATIWAVIMVWRKHRDNALLMYLFSMGVPLFVFYSLYTIRTRVQPNWIAPAVVPLLCLSVIYWESRSRAGAGFVRKWLSFGVALGLALVVIAHDTDLIRKISGRYLDAKVDPLRRVRAWGDTAKVVSEVRNEFLKEGKPVFIIGDHYGITGLMSFYMPEAKKGVPGQPLVYYQSTDFPKNQFYFWPGYKNRKGENALFIREVKKPEPAPKSLTDEFESVKDLGVREVLYRGRVFHRIQFFECRGLR